MTASNPPRFFTAPHPSGRAIFSHPLVIFGVALVMFFVTSASQANQSKTDSPKQTPQLPSVPEQPFVPDFEDLDLQGGQDRAWEFRPYFVAVWFCLDGSPALESTYQQVAADVTRRSELIDPSGWDLTTGRAPSNWRRRFLQCIETPNQCRGFENHSSLATYDKLMIVCLQDQFGTTDIKVREFDLQTRQWGPLVQRNVASKHQLGQNIIDGISAGFMPISKIDRVQEIDFEDEKGNTRQKSEVVVQIRGIKACVQSNLNEDLEMGLATTLNSPVFVNQDDRFLPVIRRTDRKGNLISLEPVEFTFLTINDQEEAVLRCSIQSYHRAPLSQRKSKRSQKFALVIRPPERSTELRFVSRGKEKKPLEGFEVFSRRPDQKPGEKNEFLGKSDWRGAITIPPSPDGLRVILVKRGARRLKRLPIIPGLYESVETTLPNDETRLYAEGVLNGLRSEILSLVAQRKFLHEEFNDAVEKRQLDVARSTLKKFKELETPSDIKNRIADEEVNLKTQTSDEREKQYIITKFDVLKKILDEEQRDLQSVELEDRLNQVSPR